MTKIDPHVHTLASDCASWPSWQTIASSIERSLLDFFCITDHGTLNGYLHLKGVESIEKKLFPGIELSTPSHGDFLVYNEDIGFLKSFERVYNLDTLKKLLENSGSAVIWAHPARNPFFGQANDINRVSEVIGLIDGIEVYNGARSHRNREYLDFVIEATKLKKLALTGGSDAHREITLGKSYTYFDELHNYQDFIKELKEGRTLPKEENFK